MEDPIAMREMIDGYFDGNTDARDELPDQTNFSPAYVHGWLNGRDDRLHAPRASAAVLREQAEKILSPKTNINHGASNE